MIQIDHVEYPKKLREKTLVELYNIMNDVHKAERINPMGEKAGYYLDEINYVCMELRRRNELIKRGGNNNVH